MVFSRNGIETTGSKQGGKKNLERDLALYTKFKLKQIDHRSKWKI